MKRSLWREYAGVQWHMGNMTWPDFLSLSISDRICLTDATNELIERHNEEATGTPPS